MYKLKVLKGSGELKDFNLQEGKFLIGRNEDCNIQLPSDGISKQHAALTIQKGRVFIEDLGSRNGTFVNSMQITKKELQPGDRISFHDYILELKRRSSRPKVDATKSAVAEKVQIRWYEPIMDVMVRRMEWKYLTLIFLFIFVVSNFAFTIPSILEDSKNRLQKEAVQRGSFVVKFIADENKKHLRLRQGTLVSDTIKLSTKLYKFEDRILAVDIINPKTKKILAPPERYDQTISTRSAVLKGSEAKKHRVEKINDKRMIISHPIYLYSQKEQTKVVAAVVQAVMNIEGIGLTASEHTALLLKSFLITFVLAVLFYILLQQYTSQSFKNIYREIDRSTKKGYRHLDLHTKFDEMNNVIHSINSVFKRTRELLSKVPESDKEASEVSSQNTDEMLKNLLTNLKEGVVILNESYEIIQMNPSFKKLASLKIGDATEKNILDVIENQDFLRNISHGLGQASLGSDSIEELEVNDIRYQIKVSATRTPDDLIDFFIVNLKRIEV